MKRIQWVMVVGIAVGIGMIGSTNATALDWFSRKPTTQPSVAPNLQNSQNTIPAAATKPMALVNEANDHSKELEYLKSCTSTPTCVNGYTLSTETCSNLLPGSVSDNSTVKSCYICTLPEKVSAIPKEKLCVEGEYHFDGFGKGVYTCESDNSNNAYPAYSPPPESIIQLCPTGMGAMEMTSTLGKLGNGNKQLVHTYKCRFAAATKETCNQCGTTSMTHSSGNVYCVLPNNLPAADPNKPCK